jgi:hypothetical protein
MIKKYLILLLTLLFCVSFAFAQRHNRAGFDNWHSGIGNEPFEVPDSPMNDDYPAADTGYYAPIAVTAAEGEEVTAAEEEEESEEGEVSAPQRVTDSRLIFSAGSSMVLVPLQFVTRGTAEHEGNVWIGSGIGARDGVGIYTGLSLSGSHEGKIGFNTDIEFYYSNNGANLWDDSPDDAFDVRLGDFMNIWIRPTDWFRFDIGRFFNPSQMGRVGGHWLSAWTVGMFGGGNIFASHYSANIGVLARFNFTETLMSKVNLPEIKGLSMYIFIPSFGMTFTSDDPDFSYLSTSTLTPGGDVLNSDDADINRLRAMRVFQRTWFTVGYRINDEMTVRAQFIGANPGGSINWTTGSGANRTDVVPYRYRVSLAAPRIETAFAYSTENYGFDFGLKTWLPISNWITNTYSQDPDNPGYLRGGNPGTYWGGLGFGLGAFYKVNDSIRINFRADGDMLRTWTGPYRYSGVDTTITNPTRLSFHLWPSYTMENKMVVMLACGLNYVGRNTVDINGFNPNEDSLDWDRSNRFRLGGGVSLAIPLFGAGSMNVGLAYNHGTSDARGGEPRTFTIPITFFMSL